MRSEKRDSGKRKQRNWKRGMAFGMAALMAGSGLYGCGKSKEPEETKDGKMTLELWTSNRDAMENDDAWYVKKIEDTFDINIEMKYRNEGGQDYQEWLTLSMTGKDAPDWFRDQAVSPKMLADFADDGVVAELDPEMIQENMPNLMAYYEKFENIFGKNPLELYAVDGKIYSIPDAFPELTQFCLMAFRQDWLDKLNLSMPTNLDELEEVYRAFTFDDPDGNGVDDTYGYVGITGSTSAAFSPMFGAFGVYPGIWYEGEDGTLTRGELEVEKMQDALTYIKKLYDDGVIDPEWMTIDYEDSKDKVISGVVGSSYQNWINVQTGDGWYSTVYDNFPDAELSVSYGPKGLDGEYGIMQFNPLAGVGLVFSKHMEEEPEKMAKYLQIFDTIAGDPSWYEAEVWGEEGVTFTKDENGNRVYTEEYSTEDARREFGIGKEYKFPSLETLLSDPEVHDEITYDVETNRIRQETRPNIVGKYDVMSACYLPVYNEVSQDLPNVDAALADFIMGKRDISEYGDFVEEWLAAGGQEALEEAQQIYEERFK